MLNRIALTMAALLVTGSAVANTTNSGTVTFNGTVTASPCSISAGMDAVVDMGQVESGVIRDGGTKSGTAATISLGSCSSNVIADITFTDANAGGGTATSYLKNAATENAAAGVGVKVSYKNGAQSAGFEDLDFSNGAVTVALNGGEQFNTTLDTSINGTMVRAGGAGTTVTAGTVLAKLNYAISYK